MTPQFLLTALVVVVMPGTGVLYTLAVALGRGRQAAAWAALGCTIGIVPHLAAAAVGLAAVLHASALLFQAVKFAGVAYLLGLAVSALRSGGALRIEGRRQAEAGWRIARRGALINILNPKLSIFFLAFLPQFVETGSEHATAQFILFGFLFQACALVVMGGVGIFAGSVSSALKQNESVSLYLNRFAGSIIMALGLAIPAREIWDFVTEN